MSSHGLPLRLLALVTRPSCLPLYRRHAPCQRTTRPSSRTASTSADAINFGLALGADRPDPTPRLRIVFLPACRTLDPRWATWNTAHSPQHARPSRRLAAAMILPSCSSHPGPDPQLAPSFTPSFPCAATWAQSSTRAVREEQPWAFRGAATVPIADRDPELPSVQAPWASSPTCGSRSTARPQAIIAAHHRLRFAQLAIAKRAYFLLGFGVPHPIEPGWKSCRRARLPARLNFGLLLSVTGLLGLALSLRRRIPGAAALRLGSSCVIPLTVLRHHRPGPLPPSARAAHLQCSRSILFQLRRPGTRRFQPGQAMAS